MMEAGRPVVVAVCGCPGAGKTTVAGAVARRLGVLLLTRDEIKVGLGLSTAAVTQQGDVQFTPDFHVAGGPVSVHAETVLVDVARLLAASGMSFVVESSVRSPTLLDVLVAGVARVVAVHVVARESVIGERLRVRAAQGGAVDHQLAARFQRGEMPRSLFTPPTGVDAVVDTVVEVDTSEHDAPDITSIEDTVIALIR